MPLQCCFGHLTSFGGGRGYMCERMAILQAGPDALPFCAIHGPARLDGVPGEKLLRLRDEGPDWLLDAVRDDVRRQLTSSRRGGRGRSVDLVGIDWPVLRDLGELLSDVMSDREAVELLDLGRSRITGELNLSLDHQVRLNFADSVVAGDVLISLGHADRINLQGLHAHTCCVKPIGERPARGQAKSLSLNFAEIDERLDIVECDIAEDLDVSDCLFKAPQSKFVVRDCTAGTLRASKLRVRDATIAGCSLETLLAPGAVLENLRLSRTEISACAAVAPEADTDLSDAEIARLLAFQDCRLAGSTSFNASSLNVGDINEVQLEESEFNGRFDFRGRSIVRNFTVRKTHFALAPDFRGANLPIETELSDVRFSGEASDGAAIRYRALRHKLDHVTAGATYTRLQVLEYEAKRKTGTINLVERAAHMGLREVFAHPSDWSGPVRVFLFLLIMFASAYYLIDVFRFFVTGRGVTVGQVGGALLAAVRFSLQNACVPYSAFDPEHYDKVPLSKALLAALQSTASLALVACMLWAGRMALRVRE